MNQQMLQQLAMAQAAAQQGPQILGIATDQMLAYLAASRTDLPVEEAVLWSFELLSEVATRLPEFNAMVQFKMAGRKKEAEEKRQLVLS